MGEALRVKRSDCEEGSIKILEHAISYAEAAEILFSAGHKQEAYVLSFLGMDELGKFFLIAKAMIDDTSRDTITIEGFCDHKEKLGEVLNYSKKVKAFDSMKIMEELSRYFVLSEIASLAYKAYTDGSLEKEVKKIDENPLQYRNKACYVDYEGSWNDPRYPNNEVCAAQIKLVKGTAKGCLSKIKDEGLSGLLKDKDIFLPDLNTCQR